MVVLRFLVFFWAQRGCPRPVRAAQKSAKINDGFWLKRANFDCSRRICMYTSTKTPYVAADYLRGDAHAVMRHPDTKTTETYRD